VTNSALTKNLRKKLVRAVHTPSLVPQYLADKRSLSGGGQSKLSWALYRVAGVLEHKKARKLLQLASSRAALHDFAGAASLYAQAIREDPETSEMYATGMVMSKSGSLQDQFFAALLDNIRTDELRAMMKYIAKVPRIYQPSQFWLYFSTYNALQIESAGAENFKRTVNKNYFNWTGEADVNIQLSALEDLTNPRSGQEGESETGVLDCTLKKNHQRMLELLYRYAQSVDLMGLLAKVAEPELGNPIGLRIEGRTITQDLCNTIMDWNTIFQHAKPRLANRPIVYELGAGHGRMGYALLKAFPGARYVVIDIPPALYVSQWYLTRLFPELKAVRFKENWSQPEFNKAFSDASLIFLSPDQAEYLPGRSCDLFINICSLQEMKLDQVRNWFRHIDRLCGGHFYTKQYYEHRNALDEESINRSDYPINPRWRMVFDRKSPTFPSLFESIYQISEARTLDP
jgi:putative sugar O-methyltransferase